MEFKSISVVQSNEMNYLTSSEFDGFVEGNSIIEHAFVLLSSFFYHRECDMILVEKLLSQVLFEIMIIEKCLN